MGVIDPQFGNADVKLRDSRQHVSLTGRVFDHNLFCNLAITGISGEAEGVKDSAINARVTSDVKKNIMVCGYILSGEKAGFSFDRTSIDTQIEIDKTPGQAAYFKTADDQSGGGSHDNEAYYIQAIHTRQTKKGKPTWVPLALLDHHTKSNGNDSYGE